MGNLSVQGSITGIQRSLFYKPDLIASPIRLHRGVVTIAEVEILAVCSFTSQSSLQFGSVVHIVHLFGIATKLPVKKPEVEKS